MDKNHLLSKKMIFLNNIQLLNCKINKTNKQHRMNRNKKLVKFKTEIKLLMNYNRKILNSIKKCNKI